MKKFVYTIATGSPVFILLYLSYLMVFNVPVTHTIYFGSDGDVLIKSFVRSDIKVRISIEDGLNHDNL